VPHRSASELTPPAEQVERFRRDLEALTGEAPAPGRKLGLAVSGGADSVALLLLAAAAYPGAVHAATVDHGLRQGSAEEAATVAGLCAQLGVPHDILAPQPGRSTDNLQERARTMRYAALRAWAGPRAPWVAVAHQRDDVAETFLMRARRGSGIGGLAAMRRIRRLEETSGTMLLRPLLDWSREELAAVPRCLGTSVVQDPSNVDPRYDRARVRALIAATPELVPSRLALSAQNLRHAEDALEWAFVRELPRVVISGATASLEPGELPYELRRRLARHAVQQVRAAMGEHQPWHEQGLDRLVRGLDAGDIGTIAGVKATPEAGKWRFVPAPPRRSH
jgi:tRNA(Ile)-lysidine synthase